MHPFFTFSKTKDPLFGTLSPSTHPLSSYPICSGFAHFVKSDLGIPSLFAGVSIVYGKIVITLPMLNCPACSERFIANECTPVFAREYAIISGWGSLKMAAAPVNIIFPYGSRYLVAR
jgi:hypothetical protein